MQIVPVIDILGGQTVHARGGERKSYAPLRSPLCPSSAPGDVVAAFLALYPFDRLYIADLDAIAGRAANRSAIADLRQRHRGLELWVDGGLARESDVKAWLADDLGRPVIGSESLRDLTLLEGLRGADHDASVILSLDFKGEALLGPAELLGRPELWPGTVIAMTLDRVGSGRGPDWNRLRAIRRIAQGRQVFAAGGLRGSDDLARLARMDIAGALVASALHDGSLGREEIDALQGVLT